MTNKKRQAKPAATTAAAPRPTFGPRESAAREAAQRSVLDLRRRHNDELRGLITYHSQLMRDAREQDQKPNPAKGSPPR